VINPFAILTTIPTIAGINYAALAGLTNNLTLLNFLNSNDEVFHGIAPLLLSQRTTNRLLNFVNLDNQDDLAS
jgi:hypothetical protein